MTTEELAKLNYGQKCVRIAELCGWTQIVNANTMAVGGIWRGYPPTGQVIGHKELLPDYLNDLNAMHEAEEQIAANDKLWSKFERELGRAMQVKKAMDWRPMWHSTAAQRADAFLLTLG